MTEIFIVNQKVDTTEELSTFLNFSVNDVREFGYKKSSYSKTIVLPGTNNNNKIFGNIYEVTGANNHNAAADNVGINFNAARSAPVIVFQDQIQIIKGTLRLMEIREDNGGYEYECQIVGELGSLAAALGNKKLEDLDFSDNPSIDWTLANIVGSWDSIGTGDGIYFPLIDYGNYSSSGLKHDWQFKTFRPALYVADYMYRIITQAGYRYECDLIDTDTRFRSLIVPFNQKTVYKIPEKLERAATTQTVLTVPGTVAEVEFTSGSIGPFTTSDDKTFTYSGGSPILSGPKVSLTGEYTTGSGSLVIDLYKNGVFYYRLWNSADYPAATAPTPMSFTKNLPPLTISSGDAFKVVCTQTGGGINYGFGVDSGYLMIVPDAAAKQELDLGDTIYTKDIIPKNILQKDFFSSILKLFNLYVYEDANEQTKVYIKPYIEFYDLNSANAVDWTNKRDRASAARIKPMSELNARYYEFKMKSDSDYYNDLYFKRYSETYGSRTYDSEFEGASDKQELEIIFAGTPLVGYSGEDKVYSTIFKKSSDSGTEEQCDSVIRILQAKKITGVSSWSITAVGGGAYASYTNYGYAGHLDDPDAPTNDINFGATKELFFTLVSGDLSVNQFNVYWSPYMAEITDKDSKLFQGKFYLTSKDINSLDLSKLVYMDGALWRINAIEDYNVTRPETSRVSLLKVIELLY